MPLTIETAESRAANFGANGGGEKLVYTLDGYTDEAVVYAIGYTSTPAYLNGFIRNDIAVEPLGGLAWRLTVSYGTTGMGGGPYPLGGPSSDGAPISPPSGDPGGGDASDSTELRQGFSFGLTFNSRKLLQSISTVSVTVMDGTAGGHTVNPNTTAIPAGGRDFKRAIGVGADGKVEGCEVPQSPLAPFKIQIGRAAVTIGFFKTLRSLVGKTNNAIFYSQAIGEMLYLGCDAEYQQSSGWTLTHNFGAEENRTNIEVNSFLTVPAKKGWEYMWYAYKEVTTNGLISTIPFQVNVEKVFDSGDFSLIQCGK